MRLRVFFRLCLIVMFAVVVGNTQSGTGTISGIVLDAAGKIIPATDIRIINDATGVVSSTSTNDEGIYALPDLPPGAYRVQVAKLGFKTLIKPDIVLHTQAALAINFTLQVGATSETVTVQGGAPLVETESSSVSTVIDRQFVENLPMNGRSFNTLLQLTPGVVIAQQPSGAASSPGQFSISGQRTDANSFTVDGVSANFGVTTHGLYSGESGTGSAQAFSAVGGTSSLVSVEALQEFRVETSSFAPEFGRSPGGQVMLTTRSGTNDFNGAVYEYLRNDAMDANDWFAKQADQPRAPERHNDFGGILGGPLYRNRTFFFFSYEGARLRLPQTSVTDVPYLDGSACKASDVVLPYLNAYPKANGPVSTDTCTGQFTGSYSNSANLDATALRIDHAINAHIAIFGRYNYAPSRTSSRLYSLNMVQTSPVNTQTFTLGVNMLFNRSAANTLRMNYSTQQSDAVDTVDAFDGAVPIDSKLLLGSLSPSLSSASFETFDTDYYATGPVAKNRTRQLNFLDDFSLSAGAHQFKFGADYRAIFLNKNPYQYGVLFLSDTVKDMLSTGTLTEIDTNVNLPSSLLSQSTSIYAQDTWKISPLLTLTYGLRWELAPAPAPRGATRLASWLNVRNPSQIALAPFGTPLWKTTYANFAPRLGLAWSPSVKRDLVIRGGWGLFYDLGTGAASDVALYFPGESDAVVENVPLPVADAASYIPTPSLNPPYPAVSAFYPDLALPRSQQWNLAVEKSFGGNQVLTATYVGQAGRDQLREEALYQPNPDFSSVFYLKGNGAFSNYHALQLQYRMHLGGSVQTLLNYTWSHSLDNASNDVVAGLSNTIISAANDYASSGFDVRQGFSGAVTYAVPGFGDSPLLKAIDKDWSLAGVVVARGGFPFNGSVRTLTTLTGGYAVSRPDRIPGQPVWIANKNAGAGKLLNAAALVAPSTLRQGTEGRNDIPGFGLTQVDLSLGRTFPLVERASLKFRADAFNVANHPNFANPAAIIGYGATYLQSTQMLNNALGGLNPLFQEGGPRSLQLSLNLSF